MNIVILMPFDIKNLAILSQKVIQWREKAWMLNTGDYLLQVYLGVKW